jgi:cytochrome c553
MSACKADEVYVPLDKGQRLSQQKISRDCVLCHDVKPFQNYSTELLKEKLISMRDGDPDKLTMMSKVLIHLSDEDIKEAARLLTAK